MLRRQQDPRPPALDTSRRVWGVARSCHTPEPQHGGLAEQPPPYRNRPAYPQEESPSSPPPPSPTGQWAALAVGACDQIPGKKTRGPDHPHHTADPPISKHGGAQPTSKGPASALRGHLAMSACQKARGGEERGHGESWRAQPHNGHTSRTRRATGPSSRNARATLNGVPAGMDKGHPEEATRYMQRGGREGAQTKTRTSPGPPP